ncbi:MAG TPA: tetratricopeptide repeat protein [Tepidisphaeraceae bacterium]|nr:tetratricopeptide repeat protein [Tepidisphaeraceae bacterium]
MGPRGKRSLAHLWQAPLLLISLGLFGYAAYLFIDPQPGLTIDQKIDVARVYFKNERPEAGIEQLNRLLTTEKLPRESEATIHLLLAEGIEAAQKQKRINIPANHARIIEQTQIALAQGIKPTGEMHRRLGESYEALDRPSDALSHYRHAIAMTPGHALRLQRKVIAMQMAQDDTLPAETSIDEYLASQELTDSERAWALGEKAQLLADRGEFVQARELLAKAIKLDTDPIAQGQVNYRLGYCAWKLGANDDAERYLRVAREQLRVQHPLDGEAAYVLGKIYQDRGDANQANSFYQVVLVSHPDSRVAPLARLGRGVCRILQGEDDAGLTDLHDLVEHIGAKPSRERLKADTLASLRQAAEVLTAKQNYQGALEVLAYEQQLQPDPPATFFARLANVYERRADQVDRTIADATPVERVRRSQSIREYRTKAGDAYVAYSRQLTLADDKGYGEALWKGIDLYDRAPNLHCVVSALELFVVERPDDSLTPDALLRLGNAYRAAGQFDKAIDAYKRNQFRYGQTLAASKSGVPLAQAYIAKGPEDYSKAEQVLIAVVDNNPLLTPEAEEFRQALFELAQLYYRMGRFEEAVGRFEELTQRYPKDERLGQLLFLIGDSYRKSAGLLDARLASADPTARTGAAEAAEALAAKRERLAKARGLYDQAIEFYRVTAPTTDNDKLYHKLSHFYRADCVYDLGSYEEAIRLYDAAAFRYQDDPSALAAYVQIVNSYCALGKIEEAKTANERAKWLLRRMPTDSFADGGFTMPKAYWEQWLKWTSAAGMW